MESPSSKYSKAHITVLDTIFMLVDFKHKETNKISSVDGKYNIADSLRLILKILPNIKEFYEFSDKCKIPKLTDRNAEHPFDKMTIFHAIEGVGA
jgi:hypothetical protein